jgi:hypothetical protein
MNNRPHTVTVKFAPTSDFASFGQSVVAYVKKIDMGGTLLFSIHGADGETLGVEANEHAAMVAAQQLNLIPVTLQ